MLRRLAGQSVWYLLGSFLSRALALLLLPIYTRCLLPSDYGILSICATISAAFALAATPPMHAAVTRFYHKRDPLARQRLLGTVWLWSVLFPLAVVLACELVMPRLVARFYPAVPWDPFLRLAVWNGYLSLATAIPLSLWTCEERPWLYVGFNLGSFLLMTAWVIYLVVWREMGALGSLQGQLYGNIATAVVAHGFILLRTRPRLDRGELAASLRFTAPFMPHSICLKTLDVGDRIILSYLIPLGAIGVYSVSYTLASLVSVFGVAFATAFSPLYFKHAGEEKFSRTLPRLLSAHVMLQTWVTLAVSMLGAEILRVMTAPAYHDGWKLIPWVAGGFWCFTAVYQPCLVAIQEKHKTHLAVVISGLPAAANVVLNVLLAPTLGVLGAAVATLLSYALMGLISLRITQRIGPLPFDWPQVGRMLAVSALFYGLGGVVTGAPLALAVALKATLLAAAGLLMLRAADFDATRLRALIAGASE